MYKLIKDSGSVIRVEDGAIIPDDPSNRHRQEYEAWLGRGNTPAVADSPPLSEAQSQAHRIIDDAAGAVRQKYVTTSPGQEATYTEKARQCDEYKAAGYPTPDSVRHSYIIAEKNAMGGSTSYQEACDSILAQRDQWAVLGAEIEEARRRAKLAVSAATTIDGVESAREEGLIALSAL